MDAEKLDLETFRELKQKITDILIEEGEKHFSWEIYDGRSEHQKIYKETINTLSQYDLSDIDSEEWKGMFLVPQEGCPIDFSKTKANLDFSIIEYVSWSWYELPNFKGCLVKNFDFNSEYGPEMFDEEFIKENKERFISEDVPKAIKDIFYNRDLPDKKKRFIERYGIDNIIALDKETGGIFSKPIFDFDIYLWLFAEVDEELPELDTNKELTYEEFKNRMYEILLHSRDEYALLTTGDCPGYDFIQGKFREEHPDIFIDGNLPEQVKEDFYKRCMKAETVRQNPELIQLLQGKDLSRVFAKKMTAGTHIQTMDIRKYN